VPDTIDRPVRRRITTAIADPYAGHSVSARLRARRWQELIRRFPDLHRMRVLDLGGDARSWAGAPVRPRSLVLLNLYPQEDGPGVRSLVGDACAPPAELLDGEPFDLVFSNSVIEHVGGHARRTAFADAVHRLAPHHWIQTPYRYFPVEPHWLFPGFQFLPFRARVRLTREWPLGHRHDPSRAGAVANVASVELLCRGELRSYFPGSELWLERLGGLTKSLVAVR